MAEPEEHVRKLMDAATELSFGAARLDLLREAVDIADTHNDIGLGYESRFALMDSSYRTSRYDLYAVTFAWLYAKSEQDPARFPAARLVEYYQDVLGKMANFPAFSREQYERLFDDMLTCANRSGHSLWSVHLERRSVAEDFGCVEMARRANAEMGRHPRQRPWEYERGLAASYHIFLGDLDNAVEIADDYFRKTNRDTDFDPRIAAESLMPLWIAGRRREAVERHDRRYRDAIKEENFWWHHGRHLSFAAVCGKFDRGIQLFQHQFPLGYRQTDPLSRLHSYRHALVLFDRLVEQGVPTVALRVPTEVPWATGGRQTYETATIRTWLEEQVVRLVAMFDARNGNSHFADLVESQRSQR